MFFLTPDLKPFYGGHYFRHSARHGPSEFFATAATHLFSSGKPAREDLNDSAIEIHARMEQWP